MRSTLIFVLSVCVMFGTRSLNGEERLLSVQLLETDQGVVIATFSHQHEFGASERTPKPRFLRICVFRDGRIVSAGEFSAESVVLPKIQKLEWRAAESTLFVVDTSMTAPLNCVKVDILRGLCNSPFDQKLSVESRKLNVIYKWPVPYGQFEDKSEYLTSRFRVRVNDYHALSLTEEKSPAMTVVLRSIGSDDDFSLDVLRTGTIRVSNPGE